MVTLYGKNRAYSRVRDRMMCGCLLKPNPVNGDGSGGNENGGNARQNRRKRNNRKNERTNIKNERIMVKRKNITYIS